LDDWRPRTFYPAIERCNERRRAEALADGKVAHLFPDVTPHDLRHTAASVAVSAGANLKVLQKMLCHSSASMTLDRYADLFEEDLVKVTDALARRAAEDTDVTVWSVE
jgi:integrase